MKQILTLTLSVLLWSCTQNKQEQIQDNNHETQVDTVEVFDDHSAKISLDYEGTYTGVVDCGDEDDCDSIKIVITLNGEDYTKTITRKSKNKDIDKYEISGKYTWKDKGSSILLNGAEEPNRYFVGENYLNQLDENGNKYDPEIAINYILKKQ